MTESDIYLLMSSFQCRQGPNGPNLKHVLFEVLLLFLAVTEPLQNQLTEVREVDETFPGNIKN